MPRAIAKGSKAQAICRVRGELMQPTGVAAGLDHPVIWPGAINRPTVTTIIRSPFPCPK
jgi:hypothetical protein